MERNQRSTLRIFTSIINEKNNVNENNNCNNRNGHSNNHDSTRNSSDMNYSNNDTILIHITIRS